MNENNEHPVRVMLVDDSSIIRGIIARTLKSNPSIEVCGTAMNGEMAVSMIRRADPDIVILDIEMPIMDGLTALPLLLKENPNAKIIICSTLSDRGAEVSVRALSMGATECILKPSASGIGQAISFQQDLLNLVLNLGGISMKRNLPSGPAREVAGKSHDDFTLYKGPPVSLPPRILAIGCSTGGPAVLMKRMIDLKDLPVPIVITQHMPPTFTNILAQNIQKQSGIPCVEGADGIKIKAGHAYVAPGGKHMKFAVDDGGKTVIKLDDGPLENFCKPSVDPMLRSLVPIYGARILTAILTGMGSDGLNGCREIVAHGGQVIAQDKETSVVWGMPRAVAMAGICSAVMPESGIGPWIRKAFML